VRQQHAYDIYLALSAADALFRTMVYTVLAVYYVQQAGLNPLQLVLVGTVLEATALVCEVPTGVVAGVYSRRLSIVIGHLLVGLCFVLEGLVPLVAAILLAEMVRGVGETCISGALPAWIADEIGEDKAARAYLRASQVRRMASLAGIACGAMLGSLHLALPVGLGGALLALLAVALVFTMPERGFRPTPRGTHSPLQAMQRTLREGFSAVRQSPAALTILGAGAAFGAFSEGFDRLWEAHFLTHIGFPAILSLQPVAWFGLIHAGTILLALSGAELVRRRIDLLHRAAPARTLLVISLLLIAGVVTFGLAPSFGVALAGYWLVALMRSLAGPLATAWLNRGLDPQVRATVLSMQGQADAFGQLAGGPAIGFIGTAVSLRAAMVAAGAMLSPALLLFGRSLRRGT
jgi:DHA3 family tetracycline resistance protein-like MFS transporter